MSSTFNQKELKTNWPVVVGTTFGSTKTSNKELFLKPVGLNGAKSLISSKDIIGI